MPQKWRLKNAKWKEPHLHVKNIIDSILEKVSEAIDIRTTAGEVVLDIVEDAMDISDETILDLKFLKSNRERTFASLRHDWLVLEYRRNPTLSITNPINGNVYIISLRASQMHQVEKVGYDLKSISSGTTKHMYAALRAIVPDIRRSTSIRIWYTNEDGEHVIVPANEMPARRLVGTKLFMTKLGCYATPLMVEDEEPQRN